MSKLKKASPWVAGITIFSLGVAFFSDMGIGDIKGMIGLGAKTDNNQTTDAGVEVVNPYVGKEITIVTTPSIEANEVVEEAPVVVNSPVVNKSFVTTSFTEYLKSFYNKSEAQSVNFSNDVASLQAALNGEPCETPWEKIQEILDNVYQKYDPRMGSRYYPSFLEIAKYVPDDVKGEIMPVLDIFQEIYDNIGFEEKEFCGDIEIRYCLSYEEARNAIIVINKVINGENIPSVQYALSKMLPTSKFIIARILNQFVYPVIDFSLLEEDKILVPINTGETIEISKELFLKELVSCSGFIYDEATDTSKPGFLLEDFIANYNSVRTTYNPEVDNYCPTIETVYNANIVGGGLMQGKEIGENAEFLAFITSIIGQKEAESLELNIHSTALYNALNTGYSENYNIPVGYIRNAVDAIFSKYYSSADSNSNLPKFTALSSFLNDTERSQVMPFLIKADEVHSGILGKGCLEVAEADELMKWCYRYVALGEPFEGTETTLYTLSPTTRFIVGRLLWSFFKPVLESSLEPNYVSTVMKKLDGTKNVVDLNIFLDQIEMYSDLVPEETKSGRKYNPGVLLYDYARDYEKNRLLDAQKHGETIELDGNFDPSDLVLGFENNILVLTASQALFIDDLNLESRYANALVNSTSENNIKKYVLS